MENDQAKKVFVPIMLGVAALGLVAVIIALNMDNQPGSATNTATGTKMPDLEKLSWKSLAEGLEYVDEKEGSGPECPPGAEITITYTGWLVDGSSFDSGTHTFKLTSLIRGWQLGIPGMKQDGVRILKIPYQLGYGDQPSGKIPARSMLIFRIELHKF